MKRLAFLLLMYLLMFAQTPNKSEVIGSGDYYYGSGTAFDVNEARDHALAELTSQIAVNVSSSFQEKLQETGTKVTENTEKILKTHSAATLRNVQEIRTPKSNGQIEVFCYLLKSEVNKIFDERKQLIAEMVRKADKSLEEQNAAYALKLYYFAGLLLNSLPDQNVICGGTNFTTEIPHRINEIVRKIEFGFQDDRMISEKEREVTLTVRYDNKPVSLLDFMFWDGTNQIAVQARDGLAAFKLYGASVGFDELKLNIKYAYYECRNEYNVVANLWELVLKPEYRSQKTVKLEKSKTPAPATVQTGESSTFNIKLEYRDQQTPAETIIRETKKLLDIFDSGDESKIRLEYSDDTFLQRKLCDYLKYNHARALYKNIPATLNQTRNGWELRKIRMLHDYPSINRQTTEYLVLDFNKEGRLCDLNTCITDYLYNKFVEEAEFGEDWGNRQEIVKFLEKYRTAYMTRDIGTVDLMFAEDAIIIVGRKLERKILPPDVIGYDRTDKQPDYEYLRLKKTDFISRQRQIFNAQKDILLDFGSFDIIRKNNDPNIYGVEMRQNYFSTSYSDEGYLFLLIDFTEVDPLIYVRAWQPNTWSEDELIRTANYKIHR